MNAGQLRAALEGVPDYTEVFIRQTDDEFANSLVEQAGIRTVVFTEDSDGGGEKAKDEVFVITDEHE